MTGLTDVLQALAARPGVVAVVLVSPDGLCIQQAGSGALDADALAALATAAVRHAARLAEGAEFGAWRTLLLEAGNGTVILSEAGAGHVLLLVVAPEASFGDLLFDVRRDRSMLGALLS
jgi:predicted regulator of Ras-like GTPase activity (Roadblock/LC7/MglB family)